MSITNSDSLAETQDKQSSGYRQKNKTNSYFFTKIGQWQHFVELLVAGNTLAVVLALAEAQGWAALHLERVLQYILYINWVLLSFAALTEFFKAGLQRLSFGYALTVALGLLQVIILVTTVTLNILMYFGHYFSLRGLSSEIVFHGVFFHLSLGILLGAICARYLYVREQAEKQQNSELNARIQAMQARIHPHFLFNSLNNVISLITIDPDKAEHMLINLSRLFRASFQELKLVALQDEIDLCQRYLEIEQVRVGDRLNVEWKFIGQDDFKKIQIPLLTLQPLVENSIFHGVEKFLTKSTISILIETLENQVNIVITNPYDQDKINRHNGKGHGIAVENVRQRLEAYYGRSVIFRTFAGKGIFTTVVQYRYK